MDPRPLVQPQVVILLGGVLVLGEEVLWEVQEVLEVLGVHVENLVGVAGVVAEEVEVVVGVASEKRKKKNH